MIGRAVLVLVALGVAAPAGASAKTVWLCKPGLERNPCRAGPGTTRFSPSGEQLGVVDAGRAARRRIDCFYVYPTVSDQPRPAATKAIDPELRSIALYEAARFSGDCRVFAPVYRQITLSGLFSGGVTGALAERAYGDVRAAWRAYLRRHARGRGFVLIGHSQGTFHLRRLIREEIEPNRALRRRLVSALLIGGNVTVRKGENTGGDFRGIRACRSPRRLRCVVAYSTFGGPVPENARFGRTSAPGLEILCTNPAALGGGDGILDPVVPRAPFAPGTGIAAALAATGFVHPLASTPWLAFPGSYSARCSSADGADVLQVTPRAGAPALLAVPPTWGLHTADVNIALGNLVRLVRRQAGRYVGSR